MRRSCSCCITGFLNEIVDKYCDFFRTAFRCRDLAAVTSVLTRTL